MKFSIAMNGYRLTNDDGAVLLIRECVEDDNALELLLNGKDWWFTKAQAVQFAECLRLLGESLTH